MTAAMTTMFIELRYTTSSGMRGPHPTCQVRLAKDRIEDFQKEILRAECLSIYAGILHVARALWIDALCTCPGLSGSLNTRGQQYGCHIWSRLVQIWCAKKEE